MNKRWRNVGLYVLAVITVIFIGTSVFDKPSTENATKTLRYSDFIEAVQDKEISRVLISPDNATAQVVENDGSRSEVNLAPDKDLLKILTENNVDIAVTPTKLANPWQQAISSLIFPVPGGRTRRTPLGIFAPTAVNLSGLLRKSTTSVSSNFAPSKTATSEKVTCVDGSI